MRRHILSVILALLMLSGCLPETQPFTLVASGELIYPEKAKNSGIMGSVVLQYDVLTDGNVSNLRVVNADPPGVFEQAAIRYVRTWKFRPAHHDGKPVAQYDVESEIKFVIEGESRVIPDAPE